jgi:hypothetical protein
MGRAMGDGHPCATVADAVIAAIYNEGIIDRLATFETELRCRNAPTG